MDMPTHVKEWEIQYIEDPIIWLGEDTGIPFTYLQGSHENQ